MYSADEIIYRIFDSADSANWMLDDEVHIWKFPVVRKDIHVLSPEENKLAARFRFEGDRNRFTVGRHSLRMLLSKYLAVPPSSITLLTDENGKPFIHTSGKRLHFNLSHSGDWVLIAAGREPVGIDVEKIDPVFAFEDIMNEHFSNREKDIVRSSPDPAVAFYQVWTHKEAITKAWGTGLQENLQMIDVTSAGFINGLDQKVWKIEPVFFSASYASAVAFCSEKTSVHYFDGESLLK